MYKTISIFEVLVIASKVRNSHRFGCQNMAYVKPFYKLLAKDLLGPDIHLTLFSNNYHSFANSQRTGKKDEHFLVDAFGHITKYLLGCPTHRNETNITLCLHVLCVSCYTITV